jgi:MFS family permease
LSIDPGRARGARGAVTVVFLASGLTFGSWASRIPAVRDRLGVSEGELGLAFGAMAAGSIVAMPLAGVAAARVGSRRVARLAITASCALAAVLAAAPSLIALTLLAIAYGACFSACGVSMNTHAIAVERRCGRPMLATFHAAFSLGVLAGSLLGALAAGLGVDARIHLAVVAGVMLVTCLLWSRRFLPAAVDRSDRVERLVMRPPRPLTALGTLAFSSLLIQGAAADWSGIYLKDDLGAAAGVAALAFTAFSLAMTAGRLVGDRLVGRHGALIVVRAGGAVAAVVFAAALAVGEPVAGIVGFGVLGAGMASVVPIVMRASASVPGVAAGMAVAAVSSTGYLGFLVGPPIIGGLAELVGLPTALGVLSVLSATIVVLASTSRIERWAVHPATEAARA